MKLDNTSTAGIKADRWIKKMSMLPTAMVEHRDVRNSTRCVERKTTSPLYHEFGSGAFYKEIERIIGKKAYDANEYRVLPYEKSERDQRFKPMIEPFEPGQVRYVPFEETFAQFVKRCVEIVDKLPEDHPDKNRTTKHDVGQWDVDGDVIGGQYVEMGMRKIVSYGTSSYGYDVRCGREFKIFTNVNSSIVDPKDFDPKSFVDVTTTDEKPYVIVPPNSFALARTVEFMRIPRNVLTVCVGKSTYARCGIIVNVTPFEPEWEGYVTLEFSNTTPLPAKIYAEEGCAQVLFFESDEDCDVSYKDRAGKYMGQVGLPVVPKM